jgi:uncharacterized membrane protein
MKTRNWMKMAAVAAALVSTTACQREPAVSYQKDVVPILDQHCKSCHLPGQPGYVVSGFDVGSYETLMKGTKFGPVVLPGDPLTSVLVMLVEGRVDPSLKMPHGNATTPTVEQIQTLRLWVEQGAKNN